MEFQNNQPIYIQIASYIKEQIASGQLHAGDKLPSVREYSVFFEVSALTIQRTMEHLVNEQLIISRKGIGNFINDNISHLQDELVSTQTRDYIQNMRSCGLSSEEIQEVIELMLKEDTTCTSQY